MAMDPKRSTAQAMLQRVMNLSKHAHNLQSTASLNVPSWNSSWYRQASTNSESGAANSVPMAPNYALGPQRRFDFNRAQKSLQSELSRRCSKIPRLTRYDSKHCLDLARDLCPQLRRALRSELSMNPRYKMIVLVTVVQITPDRQMQQSMSIVSRCLWNRETDGSITAETSFGYDMRAIATAFAVYTD